MTTRVIKNKFDLESLFDYLKNFKLPFTANITKGKNASYEQEKLARKWHREAEEQGDMTAEEYRGYCKLHFAVPILIHEDEDFAEVYNEIIRPHSYEDKIRMMMIPIDLPVTRRMKSGQKKRYLDDVHNHYLSLGFILTEPEQE